MKNKKLETTLRPNIGYTAKAFVSLKGVLKRIPAYFPVYRGELNMETNLVARELR